MAERSWMKWVGIVLIVLAVLGYTGMGYYIPGLGSLGMASIFLLVVGVILAIIGFKKPVQTGKVYKSTEPKPRMKFEYVFYIIGVIFIFASVWYFAREFIRNLPEPIKVTLLFVGVIIVFIVAEFLRGKEI